MKVVCPSCKKVVQAPDEWAGRKVKCPGCKQPVTLPRESEAAGSPDLHLDIRSLEAIETAGQPVVIERKGKPMTLKEAQAAEAAARSALQEAAARKDPCQRVCPGCGQTTFSPDIYCELICKYCGAAIPGVALEARERTSYTTDFEPTSRPETFYTGFTKAIGYPVTALPSIGAAMVIALAVVAVPMTAILLFTGAAGANEAVAEKTDFGWVAVVLTVMFIAEGVYFGAIAYYMLIDSTRATTAGSDTAPEITWNPVSLGAALAGYAALLGFYALVVIILVFFTTGHLPSTAEDLAAGLMNPVSIVVLVLLTFSVPMNMIGMASANTWDGLNPARFGAAIARTIGHYIFLFLISIIYLAIYIGAMAAVLNWAMPMILKASRPAPDASLSGTILTMLAGLGAWSVLIGVALYFACVIGRILGLFSRTYRERIGFEL